MRSLFPECRRIPAGIGDDTAVLPYDKSSYLLLTTDACVDAVDFVLKKTRPEAIGRKVVAQNLSDIAAMGGVPLYAVMTLGLPKGLGGGFVKAFYRGVKRLCAQYGVALVGGDFSGSETFFASCALVGKVEKRNVVLRSGARAGDRIFVTGRLGGSMLGRHLSFKPRIPEARFLTRNFKVRSMIDLSDGIAKDLRHILEESGKGAILYENRIPVSKAAKALSKGTGRSSLEHALCDGEDFELLFTVSPADAKRLMRSGRGILGTPVNCIGRITVQKGFYIQSSEKASDRRKLGWKGFTHF